MASNAASLTPKEDMTQQTYDYGGLGGAPSSRITWGVQRLILVNVAVFVAQLLLEIPLGGRSQTSIPGGDFALWLSFQPAAVLQGGLWKPLTYMFLHVDLNHLVMNMVGLYFFGPEVERALTSRQFVRFYVLCGAVAVLACFLSGRDACVVGASGAVMAVIVAFAVLDPHRHVYLFPLPIPISAVGLVVLFVLLQLVFALDDVSVSVATHLGGLGAGFAYMRCVPIFRRWRLRRERPKSNPSAPMDVTGEAVDNIFRFEEEKRKRK